MDRICVTESALQSAHNALEQLRSKCTQISTGCLTSLKDAQYGLDNNIKKEIQEYCDLVTATNQELIRFVEENNAAISERLGKIPEYESKVYSKTTYHI